MRDLVIFTLLPLLLILFLFLGSIRDYHRAQQFDDWWVRSVGLSTFITARAKAAICHPKFAALDRRLDREKLDPGIIRLQVQRELWDPWQRDPLALWDQWIDATLVRGNRLQPVMLRKRGDTSVHWLTDKKSFTLKTKRSSLFKEYRRLAFSTKTVLESFLANRLASEFDLLAPFTTVTPVFVNKQYYGIYRVCEVIDESFLRRHGHMPGNIFRGDTVAKDEYFKGLRNDLYTNPYIWDRVAVNNRPTAAADSTLESFLLAEFQPFAPPVSAKEVAQGLPASVEE